MRKIKKLLVAGVAGAVLATSVMGVSAAGLRDIFSAKYYAEKYKDLKEAFKDDEEALYNHFLTYGIKEGRVMNPVLDIVKYREAYGDLDEAFADNWDAYVEHYFTHGMQEKRVSGGTFDPVAYAEAYPDIKEAFGDDYKSIIDHYLSHGIQEGRTAGVTVTTASQPEEQSQPEPVPTGTPTAEPTVKPTVKPSTSPSVSPSASPSAEPTVVTGQGDEITFDELQKAISDAADGTTLKLGKNVNIEANKLTITKAVTLDLNEKTLKGTAAGMINMVPEKSLTITGKGTIEHKNAANSAMPTILTASNTTLIIEKDVVVDTTGYYSVAVWCSTPANADDMGKGKATNSIVDIRGTLKGSLSIEGTVGTKAGFGDGNKITVSGTIECNKTNTISAIYLAGKGTTTIEKGAKLSGNECGIEIRAGELIINDGEITSTASTFISKARGDGSSVTGAALAVSQHVTEMNIAVTISGGTFTSNKIAENIPLYLTDVNGAKSNGVKVTIGENSSAVFKAHSSGYAIKDDRRKEGNTSGTVITDSRNTDVKNKDEGKSGNDKYVMAPTASASDSSSGNSESSASAE